MTLIILQLIKYHLWYYAAYKKCNMYDNQCKTSRFCTVSLVDLNCFNIIKLTIVSLKKNKKENQLVVGLLIKNKLFIFSYILYMKTIHNLTVRRQTSSKLVAGISFRTIAWKSTLWSIPVWRTGIFTIDSNKSNAF